MQSLGDLVMDARPTTRTWLPGRDALEHQYVQRIRHGPKLAPVPRSANAAGGTLSDAAAGFSTHPGWPGGLLPR